MTGALDMSGNNLNNVGHITMGAGRVLHLGSVTSSGEPTLTSGLSVADEGKLWYNSDSNEVKFWNGSSAQSIGGGGMSFTGDVTGSGSGSVALTIANNAITTAKLFTNPGVRRLVATDSGSGTNLEPLACALDEILKWTASGWGCAPRGEFPGGGAATPGIFISGDTDTGIYQPGAGDLSFTNNGTPSWLLNTAGFRSWATRGASLRGGTGTATWNTYAFTGDDGTGMSSPAAGIINFATSGTDRMTINASGYVGIGTPAPSAKLELWGTPGQTLRIVDGNEGAGKVLTSDASGVANWMNLPPGSQWTTNASDIHYSAGRVGIGISTPTTELHIHRTTAGNAEVGVSATTGSPIVNLYSANSSASFIGFTNQLRIGDAPSGLGNPITPRMTILANGNVGIGTLSPGTARLALETSGPNHVISMKNATNTQVAATAYFDHTDAQMGSIGYANPSAAPFANALFMSASGSASLLFATSGTERLRITNAGNVGIGTIAPMAKLEILATTTSAPLAYFKNNSTNDPSLVIDSMATSMPALEVKNMNGGPAIKIGQSGTPIMSVSVYPGVSCGWSPAPPIANSGSATCTVPQAQLGNIPVGGFDVVICSPQNVPPVSIIYSCTMDGSGGVKIVAMNVSGASGGLPSAWTVQVTRAQ